MNVTALSYALHTLRSLVPVRLEIKTFLHVIVYGAVPIKITQWSGPPHRKFYRKISGFRREDADDCGLLGYYAASSGNLLPTFRDDLSVPSSGLKIIQQVVVIYYRCFGTTIGPIFRIKDYAASGGNLLPTFQDDLSVPSSGLKIMQQVVVIYYRRFGTTYRSHPQD